MTSIHKKIHDLAEEFVDDYILCRLGQGATDAQIKAEIEGFYARWCDDVR